VAGVCPSTLGALAVPPLRFASLFALKEIVAPPVTPILQHAMARNSGRCSIDLAACQPGAGLAERSQALRTASGCFSDVLVSKITHFHDPVLVDDHLLNKEEHHLSKEM